MGCIARLLSVISLLLILSSTPAAARDERPCSQSAAGHHHSDLIRIHQHAQKDLSQITHAPTGEVAVLPLAIAIVMPTADVGRVLSIHLARPPVYRIFRSGLSPPGSSA